LVVFFLLHRKLYVQEEAVKMIFERKHLIPFDDDEGFIYIPSPVGILLATGPKCNDLPNPYSVLRLSLARAIGHSGSAQASTFSNAGAGDPAGRAIITSPSNTGDEISVNNDPHAGHQTIDAPERSRHR
uniref:RING-type E3 ubiquitin transferase n=1 Tax=Schistocephalus solidus TaxID=70667 RepID=A0A183TAL4_SCHSO